MPLTEGTRDQILSAALDLFRTQGYDRTSLRQIAESTDLTKAAVYYHFPAKDQIIIELTRPLLEDLEAMVTQLSATGPPTTPAERIRVLSDYLDHLCRHHEVISLLREDPATQRHPEVGQRAVGLSGELVDLLAGPDADAAEGIRVSCAFSAMHGILLCEPDSFAEARPVVLGAAWAALVAPAVPDEALPGSRSDSQTKV